MFAVRKRLLIIPVRQLNVTTFLKDAILAADLARRDLLHDIEGAAKGIVGSASTVPLSAIDAIDTAFSEAFSKIESAAGALATPIQELEQMIQGNRSIGTYKIYVSYLRDITCFDTPMNVSSLVLDMTSRSSSLLTGGIKNAFLDGVNQLQPLADRLNNISMYFEKVLILGLVLMGFLFVVFMSSVFASLLDIFVRLGICFRAVIVLAFALMCCVLFAAPTISFELLRTAMKNLPLWIEAQSGEVSRLCLGAFVCAFHLALLTAVTPFAM